jgi:hypothetical protein
MSLTCISQKAEHSSPEAEEKLTLEEQVKKLVENGDIPEARNLLAAIPSGISQELDNWRRLLAPPKARAEKSASGGDTRKDIAWLENNAAEYRGKWVALKDGELLGSHESLLELHRLLKEAGRLEESLFIQL